MMEIDFKCIADKCNHTCCKGWEIDIDDETYEVYQNLPGEFGDRIRKSIATDKTGDDKTHHFVLSKDERCPFLNERNLCDIILNVGEDYLCDICHEHPRFYKESDGGEFLCGYGLCCEEAARLTLFPAISGDDSINAQRDFVKATSKVSDNEILELCKLLAELESIEKSWKNGIDKLLCKLNTKSLCKPDSKKLCKPTPLETTDADRTDIPKAFSRAFYYLYQYMLFRYDSKLYATMMCAVIMRICEIIKEEKGVLSEADLIETVRVYSADIEYSDENVEIIMNYLEEKMFETMHYVVASIDGDYANLQKVGDESAEPKLVARALLPAEITEGCHLKYEMMSYYMEQ